MGKQPHKLILPPPPIPYAQGRCIDALASLMVPQVGAHSEEEDLANLEEVLANLGEAITTILVGGIIVTTIII